MYPIVGGGGIFPMFNAFRRAPAPRAQEQEQRAEPVEIIEPLVHEKPRKRG